MEPMKEVTRYQCKYCKKVFVTPNNHRCKFNPKLKNCFTCKNFKRWINDSSELHEIMGLLSHPYPDCASDMAIDWAWDIENIKTYDYDMQCVGWKEGKYDSTKDLEDDSDPLFFLRQEE